MSAASLKPTARYHKTTAEMIIDRLRHGSAFAAQLASFLAVSPNSIRQAIRRHNLKHPGTIHEDLEPCPLKYRLKGDAVKQIRFSLPGYASGVVAEVRTPDVFVPLKGNGIKGLPCGVRPGAEWAANKPVFTTNSPGHSLRASAR